MAQLDAGLVSRASVVVRGGSACRVSTNFCTTSDLDQNYPGVVQVCEDLAGCQAGLESPARTSSDGRREGCGNLYWGNIWGRFLYLGGSKEDSVSWEGRMRPDLFSQGRDTVALPAAVGAAPPPFCEGDGVD